MLLAAAIVGLSACATIDPNNPDYLALKEINDPYENTNRRMFAFNEKLDDLVLEPASRRYRDNIPEPARNSVRNFLDNLQSPVIFINDILQGEPDRAGHTYSRFLINTTVGVLGLFDVASRAGVEKHSEDFGQTLAVWGVNEGPYIMLPFLGPAPPRDMVGMLVDRAFHPLNYVGGTETFVASTTVSVVGTIQFRSENIENIETLERTSLDYYATVRSIYRQNRAAEIANGQDVTDDLDDFDFDMEEYDDFDMEEESEGELSETDTVS